jgi:hypothetical protein
VSLVRRGNQFSWLHSIRKRFAYTGIEAPLLIKNKKCEIPKELPMTRLTIGLFTVAFAFLAGAVGVNAATQESTGTGTNWENKAEQSFFLPPGTSSKLMTKEEWQKHLSRMQNMQEDERSAYRKEWHGKMMYKAREKGVELPDLPHGHGKEEGEARSLLLAQGGAGGFGRTTDDFGSGAGGTGSTGTFDRDRAINPLDRGLEIEQDFPSTMELDTLDRGAMNRR